MKSMQGGDTPGQCRAPPPSAGRGPTVSAADRGPTTPRPAPDGGDTGSTDVCAEMESVGWLRKASELNANDNVDMEALPIAA